MPDISISVPYNGGLTTVGFEKNHYCDLGNGLFLHVAAQTGPNYLYAYVTTNTNINTGTFSQVASPMRAIMANYTTAAGFTRLWKLTATSALMIFQGSLYVLTVDANNDVTLKAATIGAFFTGATSSATDLHAAVIGQVLQGWYVRDNTVYFNYRTHTTGVIRLIRVVYDPAADTLTQTTLVTSTNAIATSPYSLTQGAPAGTNYTYLRGFMEPIVGTTRAIFYTRGMVSTSSGVAMFNGSYVYGRAIIVDLTNDTVVTTLPVSPSAIMAFAGLASDRILGLSTSKDYFTFNGTAWSTAANFAASGNTAVYRAIALDANYFALVSITGNPENYTAAHLRIGRFVDSTFGQTSSSTSGSSGAINGRALTLPTTTSYDQEFFTRPTSDSLQLIGRTNVHTPVPSLRVIYQAGG